MLGQLFRSLNGNRRRSTLTTLDQQALESVTEDVHTRSLLWPDAESLDQQDDGVYPFLDGEGTTKQGHFDLVESDAYQEVRVLVAQDETGAYSKTILFDSKKVDSPVAVTSALKDVSRRVSMVDHGVVVTSPSSLPRHAPALKRASRASSNIGGGHTRASSGSDALRTSEDLGGSIFTRGRSSFSAVPESAPMPILQRTSKDLVDDGIGMCLDCMFGKTALSYLGSGTKVHWIPVIDSDSPGDYNLSEAADIRTRQTALITRTFSVDVEDELTRLATNLRSSTDQARSEQQESQPSLSESKTPKKPPFAQKPHKRRKPPSYAVGLLVPVGNPPSKNSSPASSRTLPRQNSLASVPPQDFPSLASSVDSMIQMRWSSVFDDSGADYMTSSRTSIESNEGDTLTDHWDTILRILANLQSIATEEIRARLIAIEVGASSDVQQALTSQKTKRVALPVSLQKVIRLGTHDLAENGNIKRAAKLANLRIEQAVSTRHVIVGQDRWSIWREEARWISRWAKQKERAHFMQTILSAFLSIHTGWLDLVRAAIPKGKRPHFPKLHHGEFEAIRSRTIVVSPDRALSRRLIFLLSSFLPGSSGRKKATSKPRMKRSESMQQTFLVPVPDQHPASQVSSDLLDRSVHECDSDSGLKKTRSAASMQRLPDSGISLMQSTERRGSSSSRRITLASSNSTPVAHFAIPYPDSPFAVVRKGSSSSLASVNLTRSLQAPVREEPLKRVPSRAPSSYRWGSLASFWNNGQVRGLTPDRVVSERSPDEQRLAASPGTSPMAMRLVVGDVSSRRNPSTGAIIQDPERIKSEPVAMVKGPGTQSSRENSSNTKSTTGALPFKLSVNEKDGVIDVSMAPSRHDASSLESSGLLDMFSPPGEAHSQTTDFSQHPSNVAGYLPRLSQDAILQAVKPYDHLMRDIRRAMSAEPTTSASQEMITWSPSATETWIPVATTLVIDLRNLKIRRVRLSRHIRVPQLASSPSTVENSSPRTIRRPYMPAYSATPPLQFQTFEEKFDEEGITSVDAEPVLIKAMERLLAQNIEQHAPIPPRSQDHAESTSNVANGKTKSGIEIGVPRQDVKKTVLAALREVVEDALDASIVGGGEVVGQGQDINGGSLLRVALGKLLREQSATSTSTGPGPVA